jgi:hypothetical protein
VAKLNLDSVDTYKASVLSVLQEKLQGYFIVGSEITINNIKENIHQINRYPNLAALKPLDHSKIVELDESKIDISPAKKAILDGKFFWEHAAAGEATRLGLGTKYLIDISTFTKENIFGLMQKEAILENNNSAIEKIKNLDIINPKSLLPISLGTRHMLQMTLDIQKLAKEYNKDPQEVLHKQKTLIILNKKTCHQIIDEFKRYDYFKLAEENVYFMVQEDFHGINIENGILQFNENIENRRLHNHGQMAMQKTHEKNIFHFVQRERKYLSSAKFFSLLETCNDLLSYNVEDIEYLLQSIDYPSLTLALELGKKGYGMAMEIVGQNTLKPQKGGAAFFDNVLKKNVMIENFALSNFPLENIMFLNKNFNHYPNPAKTFRKLKESGLGIPISIKEHNKQNFIYCCPPQGDINFLVKTAFIKRKNFKPIRNWKSPATTPPTIEAMHMQDKQPGFKELAKEIGALK